MRSTIKARGALLAGAVLAAAALTATVTASADSARPTANARPAESIRPAESLSAADSARAADGAPSARKTPLVEAVSKLTRSTQWTEARRLKLDFPTYHPQGFARVGDRLFLSSVEVIEAPVKYPQPVDGYDRSPGKGRGHLFVLDLQGKLLKDIVLGEGNDYHPGGIDTDGRSLWVPVAEYRPYSHSLVYRIDLKSLAVHEEFEVDDHVGGIVPDPATGELHGVTWGSREFYTWNGRGRQLAHSANSSHFVDYQDCAYAQRGRMLCTGITNYKAANGSGFELGGIALLGLRSGAVQHEVPVQLWSSAGHVATRNPVHLEAESGTLRMWAAPDDGEEASGTEILVYEAKVD
ncbi:hypothetical protein HUT18_05535 [Streptomyces sp. NA04227]|uniref:DUF6454 family protein n=1 Tax=Streptomyces sp. NA04227 TaxID=2742136 RepID=UPI0015906926|nr:DUF6454 family protein [Streptomyces sp. NA04227]QKW05933.1 hypothetical protein HUT18_05535 [Streptomyces sp. NA04227]